MIYSLFGLLIETLKSPDLNKVEKAQLRTTCRYFMDEVGKSSKSAASALLSRTTGREYSYLFLMKKIFFRKEKYMNEGSHADLLLKMLQDEVSRAKGRKWATVMRRVGNK